MPPQLRRFIEDKGAAASNSDHKNSIRKRLKKVMDLFKISRYRAYKFGTEKVNGGATANGGSASGKGQVQQANGKGSAGGGNGKSGTRRSHNKADDGKPGREAKTDPFPAVTWISTEDGSREPGQLEDRAARYLPEQNLLQINADFSAFTDMIDHCCSEVSEQPGARDVAETAVRTWYEQTLIETVIGVQALRQRKEWSTRDLEKALSPEALTATVMPRYHIALAAKREIARQLGPCRPPRARQGVGGVPKHVSQSQEVATVACASHRQDELGVAKAVQGVRAWN
jgi:hypothetical protein